MDNSSHTPHPLSGPNEATRVRSFAKFFKNYMSVSAVVAAALPIPVTSLKFIPTFKVQTSLLSTYTSLFCFLMLGFIFYSRHGLARIMFDKRDFKSPGYINPLREFAARITPIIPRILVNMLPALLIIGALLCVFEYHASLDASLVTLITSPNASPGLFGKTAEALESAQSWQIPNGTMLMVLYLGIFILAESAFIVMALKEYLQDLLKIEETELIWGPRKPSGSETGSASET